MDIDSLNAYKSMICDSIISNDLSKEEKREYLSKFVDSVSIDDLSARAILTNYLNTELDKYFFDSEDLSDEELSFLDEEFKSFFRISRIDH